MSQSSNEESAQLNQSQPAIEPADGDQITVGDITKAKGVAIGRDAMVIINEVLSKPLLWLIGLLILVIALIIIFPKIIEYLEAQTPRFHLEDDSENLIVSQIEAKQIYDVILQDRNEWYATEVGLIQLDEDNVTHTFFEDKTVYTLAEGLNDSNIIWVGLEDGILGRIDLALDEGEPVKQVKKFDSEIEKIELDDQGNIWVATKDGQITAFSEDGVEADELLSLPGDRFPWALAFLDIKGQSVVWAVSEGRLFQWRNGQWGEFTEEDDVVFDGFNSDVVSDQNLGVWVNQEEKLIHISGSDLSRKDMVFSSCGTLNTGEHDVGIIQDIIVSEEWIWVMSENLIAKKKLGEKEMAAVCDGWHIFVPESESVHLLYENLSGASVDNDKCTALVIANNAENALRMKFNDC